MLNLITQLVSNHSDDIKASIEMTLKEGYLAIHELRSRSFNKTLNLEDIQRVRSYFNSQKFDVIEISISDRYLRKYILCLSNFWECHRFYEGSMISQGKFDLLEALIETDPYFKYYFDSEFTKVLRSMEDCWIASNQIYTKFLINLINKQFRR